MPRWVFLLGVGVLLVTVAFVVTTTALGPRPGVTEANARRIKPGMTMAEVEAIMGHPAYLSLRGGGLWHRSEFQLWNGPDCAAWVDFAAPGDGPFLVERVGFGRKANPNPLDRLRSLLGR
jgi:hypothetical protein